MQLDSPSRPLAHGNSLGNSAVSVGGYVLDRELHRSAFSALHVTRAFGSTPLETPCLVRCLIAPDAHRTREPLLLREARLGELVQSRHVTRVFPAGDGVTSHTVIEYVPGASLEQLLAHVGGQSPQDSPRAYARYSRLFVALVVDVLRGLAAMHENRDAFGRGISHQAPVPRHVVVGFDGFAKLTDFTQAIGRGFELTDDVLARLRPDEMAPEQVLAPESAGPATDVFIAAGTLWRVLTGQSLFADATQTVALQKMLRLPIPSLHALGVDPTQQFDRLCSFAFVRSPGQRLSAGEFADLLQALLDRSGPPVARSEIAELVRQVAADVDQDASGVRELRHPLTRDNPHGTLVGVGPLPSTVQRALESALHGGRSSLARDESAGRWRMRELAAPPAPEYTMLGADSGSYPGAVLATPSANAIAVDARVRSGETSHAPAPARFDELEDGWFAMNLPANSILGEPPKGADAAEDAPADVPSDAPFVAPALSGRHLVAVAALLAAVGFGYVVRGQPAQTRAADGASSPAPSEPAVHARVQRPVELAHVEHAELPAPVQAAPLVLEPPNLATPAVTVPSVPRVRKARVPAALVSPPATALAPAAEPRATPREPTPELPARSDRASQISRLWNASVSPAAGAGPALSAAPGTSAREE